MRWHVQIVTATGDFISQSWHGHEAERRARRAFAPLAPIAGSGLAAVRLMRGASIHSAALIEEKR